VIITLTTPGTQVLYDGTIKHANFLVSRKFVASKVEKVEEAGKNDTHSAQVLQMHVNLHVTPCQHLRRNTVQKIKKEMIRVLQSATAQQQPSIRPCRLC